jgi:surface carbohydrate biosynthesis protein (TIGR04326 family)
MITNKLNENKPFVILDEGEIWKGKDANLVYWSELDVPDNCISIPSLVDANGTELKHKYIFLIEELGNKVISGKSLKKHLETTNHLSFWWLTLLSEKSTWKSKEIYSVFKAIILESLLMDYKGDEVIIFSKNKVLCSWLKIKIKNSRKDIIINKGKSNSNYNVFSWKRWLPHPLQAFLFICRYVYQFKEQLFCKKKLPTNILKAKNQNIIITYSDNIDVDAFSQGRIYSGYWSGLDRYFDLSDSLVHWLMMFIPDKEFPRLKSALDARDKANNNNSQQVIFLEEFLSIKVLFKIMGQYLTLALRTLKISFLLSDKKNVLYFLKTDWLSSIRGISAIDGCIKLSLFEEALDYLPINNNTSKGLYTYENQAWERALVYLWKKKTSQEIIGFQHISGKFYDLRPFDAYSLDGSNAGYDNEILPDKVVVTGEAAKYEMHSNQFPAERLFIAESLRNLDLKNCIQVTAKAEGPDNQSTLLIVTDYMPSASNHQLKLVSESWEEISKLFQKVIIKPHPNCPVDSILDKYGLKTDESLVIKNCPLTDLWNKVDVVFASNATAASLESAYMQLPTIVCLDSNNFNMSPLRGVKGVPFVATSNDFKLSLSNPIIPNISDNYFCLDHSLEKWRNLLKN